MTIIAEDGSGVVGAETYADVDFANAYWLARAHTSLETTWTAAEDGNKEGALREATDYCDATWGEFYLGTRSGYLQGLLWPRSDAKDDAGYPLPNLPQALQNVVCELAARALTERLASDDARGGDISKLKAGSVEITYAENATSETSYGVVAKMLGPVLNGNQPGAAPASWHWA